MSLSFDRALGIHGDALQVRSRRMELLASNVANADTPQYKARDLDFRQVLKQLHQPDQLGMSRTHMAHLDTGTTQGALGGEPLYRVPNQPSLDGNTVDPQLEQATFAENAVQYQASLDFLSDKFVGLRNAFRGGE